MKLLKLIALILGFFIYASPYLPAQEEDTTAKDNGSSAEDLKGRMDGIDENVTTLLTDVAGLKKIKISGYIQAQFEKTEAAKGFGFSPYDSTDFYQSRFRVRRGRIKFTYDGGITQMVIQGDFTNDGVKLKDAFLKLTDPWVETFALTMGVFNRPVYEVEYSSSQRESMERARVITTLYPDERDLGAMLTIAPEELFQLQLAAFNNTYLGAYKQTSPIFRDEPLYYMARITKEFLFPEAGLGFDIGAHARYGNVTANRDTVYESEEPVRGNATVITRGDKLTRSWFGVEAQIYYDLLGGMKLMGEYITGNDVNELPIASSTTTYNRKRSFNGYYVMLVKNIGEQFQFAAKYDVYNPNTDISDDNISAGELQRSTLGAGIHNYSLPNTRISVWYDLNMTETNDRVMKDDPVDNLLTVRFQVKF